MAAPSRRRRETQNADVEISNASTLANFQRSGGTAGPATREVDGDTTNEESDSPSVLTPHPRYLANIDTWRWLGWAYEGDGPYLDGSALVPHTREATYAEKDGRLDPSAITGTTAKFERRKALARYDNLAAPIVDTVADYLFAEFPSREGAKDSVALKTYLAWLADVDGQGTKFDDWLDDISALAFVYGFLAVTVERRGGQSPAPKSAAEQGRLVLRVYTPPDILDWIWTANDGLRAIKLLEGVPRANVTNPLLLTAQSQSQLGMVGSSGLLDDGKVTVRVWNRSSLTIYDTNGNTKQKIAHPYGAPPVVMLYHKRRKRVPYLGASMLGDPRMYRDHFNLVSEMRELLRANTFSMLAIGLGETEEVSEAKGRLGDRAATDTIIWHKKGADYISPSDGPINAYVTAISDLERKMFRRVGLAWDSGDSYAPEAADSRRIKAMDLNRILSGQADESQRFEHRLARMWHIVNEGNVARGLAAYDDMGFQPNYPDEFYTQSALEQLEIIQAAEGIGFGRTAHALLRKAAVPILLRNVDEETKETINKEIEEAVDQAAEDKKLMSDLEAAGAQSGVTVNEAKAAALAGGSPKDIAGSGNVGDGE